MAVAMTTFGSTLSDLQKLTNDDRALDYSRANFQDDVNARRLSDFLRARSEENRTKAQRDADAARLLDAQQERAQRGSQFNTQQQNLMSIEGQRIAADKELQGMAGTNALEIARLQAANRQMDPRMFQAMGDLQAVNQEDQQRVRYATQLSNTRKAALAERARIKADQGKGLFTFDVGQPDDPRWKELNDVISNLDAQATSLGIALGPDGGYVVPEFTPMQVPAMFNPSPAPAVPAVTQPVVPQTGPLPFLSTDAPAARFRGAGASGSWAPEAPTRTFEVTPDGRFFVP